MDKREENMHVLGFRLALHFSPEPNDFNLGKKGIAPKSTIETYFDRLGLNLIFHQLFLVKNVKQCAGLILNMSFHRLFYILIYYIHASKIFMIIMY